MAYEKFSYLYDRLMEEMPYDQWLEFARGCWDKFGTPRTVVDLGCGTGSIALPLARQGYEVIGMDLSEDMLAVAQYKAETAQKSQPFRRGGSITFLQQDLREWTAGKPVDSVISFCDCFSYLLEEGDFIRGIQQTYQGLRPGGVFLFDVHTPQQLRSYAAEQPFHLNEEDIAYIWTCDFDEERCQIEHALTLFVKDEGESGGSRGSRAGETFERVEELHVQRAYELAWIEGVLREAGFREVNVYGDFLFKRPTEDTARAFFAAVK